MKIFRSLVVVCCLLFIPAFSFGQWYEVSAAILDVCRTADGTVYASGGGGAIRKSYDGGASWDLLDTKVTWDLYAVFFIDDNVGFASGENGVIKTTDAGKTWSVSFDDDYSQEPTWKDFVWYSIYFVNGSTGYVINDCGALYKTVDAGANWNKSSFPFSISASQVQYFNQVFFVDASNGYVCLTNYTDNDGEIYRTTDGGGSWEEVFVNSGDWLGRYIQFADANHGYAIKNANVIRKTNDGGKTWVDIHIGINDYLIRLHFINSSIGYAVGYAGSILKTYDGGVTWVCQKSNVQHTLTSIISFDSDNDCIAVGSNATILRSNNGGMSWSLRSLGPPSNEAIISAGFADAKTVFAIGQLGTTMKSTDGGITWIPVSSFPVGDIRFVDDKIAYVAGGDAVWKTVDGGTSWNKQPISPSAGLQKIFVLNKDEVFGLGWLDNVTECYKAMWRTSDGGNTWISVDMHLGQPSQQYASSIAFINDSVGFLSGCDDIFITKDRGVTWALWTYPNCSPCAEPKGKSHLFLADSVLYMAGNPIWRSADYGKSWMETNYGISRSKTVSMYCTNASTMYLLGEWFEIIKTVDSGNSWQVELYRTDPGSYEPTLLAFSSSDALALGAGGAIYKPAEIDGGVYTSIPMVNSHKNPHLVIYPNPSDGTFSISHSGVVIHNVQLEVYDMQGRLVYRKCVENSSSEKIDLSYLPPGCYSIAYGNAKGRLIIN